MKFSLRRMTAVMRKEFLHVARDWRSLALAFAIPMVLIWLFGYALTMDLKNVPTIVWDQSRTDQSRDFLSHIIGSPYFRLNREVDNYRDLGDALDRRNALLAIVIPADFADLLSAGRQADVQVILEGSDANNANLAMVYMNGLAQLYNGLLGTRQMALSGRDRRLRPIQTEMRAWYNPDLRSRNVIVPGIIALVMVVIAAMMTSVTVAREWEMGSMEQLISTPLKVPELLIGKVIPYFAIGIADVAIAVAMGRFIFNVPFRGNAGLLFAMASIFLCGALFLGMTLSVVLKTQVLANQISVIANYMPTLLLSGFVFSIHNMPLPIQVITYIIPGRYFIALLRGIYLKGIGLEILWFDALLLAVYAAITVIVAHFRMRLKLEA